jgi:hypothetical protein
VFLQVGGPLAPYAAVYTALAANLTARVRSAGPDWLVTGGYGLHALAAAVNGGWTTAAEQGAIFSLAFNDSGLICSLSNFDSGFIALVRGRRPAAAVEESYYYGPPFLSCPSASGPRHHGPR